MKGNGFDNVAPYYDLLAKIVFGSAIIKAQTHFLGHIEKNQKVLIAGGGTGKILEYIGDEETRAQVDFVELSEVMLSKARKRNIKSHVSFYQENINSFRSDGLYDIIICPFILDVFETEDLRDVVNHLRSLLRPAGKLLFTDFCLTKGPTRILNMLIPFMYLFFRLVGALDNARLPDFDGVFNGLGFHDIAEKHFFGQLIVSRVYKMKSMD